METKQITVDKSQVNFTIQNNLDTPVLMSFMGNFTDTQDISNQTTSYSWDITGFDFISFNLIRITTRAAAQPVGAFVVVSVPLIDKTLAGAFVVVSVPLIDKTLAGAVAALNTLGISSFFSLVSGGNTYIQTYNDAVEFTALEITANGYTSQIEYILTQAEADVTPTSITDVTSSVTYLSLPAPYDVSGLIPNGQIFVPTGDTFSFFVSLSVLAPTLYVMTVEDRTNSIILYTNTVSPGTTDSFSWSTVANTVYRCTFVPI